MSETHEKLLAALQNDTDVLRERSEELGNAIQSWEGILLTRCGVPIEGFDLCRNAFLDYRKFKGAWRLVERQVNGHLRPLSDCSRLTRIAALKAMPRFLAYAADRVREAKTDLLTALEVSERVLKTLA